ncbi:isoleucine--tRNA ligase, cytoplasmic [Lactuca sativa]|nr:isoleucine--tRNA ligase, cytoplasmic [Lactuca sativa]XP_052620369.1 isoleucine--tRNA ligase, cytoplasmic [Lactuca sativa]XP_052620370.1 isoleucine--tRNA ligase, cytoplasmic [Lactuca sativa]XP_052620371.1 isoleucine--tRNA ligase, cytoplasmic [Lactuca sativa]
MNKEQMDASGDGDVKVVLDFCPDDSLSKAGFADEVVKCIQELREISELEPTYPVEVYFKSLDDDTSASAKNLKSQEAYIKEAICSPLLDSTLIPEHAVVIAEKTYRNISNCDFEITLTRQTLTFNDKAILDLYSGNAKYANALKVYLLSRDHFNLKTEFLVGINQIKVDCIEGLPDVDVVLGEQVFLTVGDYYSQATNNNS